MATELAPSIAAPRVQAAAQYAETVCPLERPYKKIGWTAVFRTPGVMDAHNNIIARQFLFLRPGGHNLWLADADTTPDQLAEQAHAYARQDTLYATQLSIDQTLCHRDGIPFESYRGEFIDGGRCQAIWSYKGPRLTTIWRQLEDSSFLPPDKEARQHTNRLLAAVFAAAVFERH